MLAGRMSSLFNMKYQLWNNIKEEDSYQGNVSSALQLNSEALKAQFHFDICLLPTVVSTSANPSATLFKK